MQLRKWIGWMDRQVRSLNKSKFFAGFIIILLNISSKFVSFKFSKGVEAYLKHSFSRDALVFAMAWMGTRDIYTALVVTSIFMICMNYLFNEDSSFCCLPQSFIDYHKDMAVEEPVKTKDVVVQ